MSWCECNFSCLRSPGCPKVATITKMRLSRKNQSDHFSSQRLALGHKSCHSPQQQMGWGLVKGHLDFFFPLGKKVCLPSYRNLFFAVHIVHRLINLSKYIQTALNFLYYLCLRAARDKCLHPGTVTEGKCKDCGDLKGTLPLGTDFLRKQV